MSQGIDVKQWLSDNQLLDVLDTFVKRQICIEELIEFDINDIQEFALEIGLDTLQRNRFVKGIQNLKSQNINNNNNNNKLSNNGVSILNNYYDETTKLIEELQSAFKIVDESVKFCKTEVNKACNELFEKLKIQQTKILKDIDENSENKKNEIGKQLQIMIDSRIEMKQLDYKQIKQFKSMVAASTNYKITYKYNKTAQNNLLSSMHIKSSQLPSGCVIIINPNNITSNSIKISWAINSESAIKEYEIQYAKFKQIGASKKDKNIKNVKKKKKKVAHAKKKKKKTKYDYDSSSSSSSSSDSSSSASDTNTDIDTDTESSTDIDSDIDEKEIEQIKMENIDIKQLQFKSIKFKNTDKILKKNSYKLKKLSRGYCYILRMRSKNELGWSEWSEIVKVFTNKDNKWQFQENNWIWKDFDASVAKKIQNAYDNGKRKYHFDISTIAQSYCINFKLMEQINVKTRKVRKIRIVHR